MSTDKTPNSVKLDERNHVEKPLLDQLDGLGQNWGHASILDSAERRDLYAPSKTWLKENGQLLEQTI